MKVTINGVVTEGTPEEIKEYFELLGAEFPVNTEPKEAEVTPKFKKGDKVRSKWTGEIVEVFAYQPKKRTYGYDIGQALFSPEKGFTYIAGNHEHWDFIEDYELVTDEPEETPTKPKDKPATIKRKARVGERILITDASSSGSQYDNGDILTVRKVVGKYGTYDAIQAEGVSIGIFDYEYEVIGEECAEAKRKPGEFKKGDIVRYLGGASFKGAIAEVYADTDGGQTQIKWENDYGVCTEFNHELELIAPVEARVDGSFE